MTPELTPAAVGIDVGGTKVAVGAVFADGHLEHTTQIETRSANGAAALLDRVATAAVGVARQLEGQAELAGVGVAVCELVDLDGEIRSAASIPWTAAEVHAALTELGAVTIEADVRAAAAAEARFGAGRDFSSFVYVTIGTGISYCLVCRGEPYAGAHGSAQLIGSTTTRLRCPHCGGVVQVALEEVASGPALVALYNDRAGGGLTRAEELLALAGRGVPAAVEVVDEATETLGSFLALLVNVVDPEAVVVGGGLGSARGAYWEGLVRATRDHIWADHVRTLPIVQGRLGPDAGLIGAGWTGFRRRAAA
jgi:predicted NBD/HSP70 family sugar kinase